MSNLNNARRLNDKTYISRSKLGSVLENPLNLINDYSIQGQGYKTPGLDSPAVGTEVHLAIQEAIEDIMESKKILAGNDTLRNVNSVKSIINDAKVKAISRMTMQKTGLLDPSHVAFVKNAIDKYGEMFLSSNKTVYLEKQMEAFKKDKGMKYSVGGRMDMVYFDHETNQMHIVDWKDHGDTKFTNLSDTSRLKQEELTRTYSLLFSEQSTLDQLNIKMTPEELFKSGVFVTYEMNGKIATNNDTVFSKKPNMKTVTLQVTQEDISVFKKEMSKDQQNIYNSRLELDELIAREGQSGLSKWVSKQMKEGTCRPSVQVCSNCPASLMCPRSKVTKDKIAANVRGADKNYEFGKEDSYSKSITADIYKEAQAGSRNARIEQAVDKYSKLYKLQQDSPEVERYREAITQNITEQDNVDYINILAKQKGEGAIEKTALSFLDTNLTETGIYDKRFKHSVKNLSHKYLRDQFDKLGYKEGSVYNKQIIENMGYDKSLQKDLYEMFTKRAADIIQEEGIHHSHAEYYAEQALKDHKKIISNDAIIRMQQYLDERVVSTIQRHKPEIIQSKLGSTDSHKNVGDMSVKDIINQVVPFKDPETVSSWKDELVSGRSAKSLLKRYSLAGKKKFPITTAMAAFFLSYYAGISNSNARQYNQEQKENELQNQRNYIFGQGHQGALSTSSRLIGSDFGSKYRVNGISKFLSKIMMNKDRVIKSAKDLTNKAISENGLVELGKTTKQRAVDKILDSDKSLMVTVGTIAAAGTVVLPRISSEAKYKRRKQYEDKSEEDNQFYKKDSKYQKLAKLSTPFGSPIISQFLIKGIEKIATRPNVNQLSQMKDYISRFGDKKILNKFHGRITNSLRNATKYLGSKINDSKLADARGLVKREINSSIVPNIKIDNSVINRNKDSLYNTQSFVERIKRYVPSPKFQPSLGLTKIKNRRIQRNLTRSNTTSLYVTKSEPTRSKLFLETKYAGTDLNIPVKPGIHINDTKNIVDVNNNYSSIITEQKFDYENVMLTNRYEFESSGKRNREGVPRVNMFQLMKGFKGVRMQPRDGSLLPYNYI